MQIEVEPNCPLNNFEPCKKTGCAFFVSMRGTNPNTGAEIDEWGCAVAWLPLLLVENSSKINGITSATESFRNEMVKGQNVMNHILAADPEKRNEIRDISSLFGKIGRHQRAIETNNPDLEDETIRQLSNNKIKVKKRKKGKKDGNNSK